MRVERREQPEAGVRACLAIQRLPARSTRRRNCGSAVTGRSGRRGRRRLNHPGGGESVELRCRGSSTCHAGSLAGGVRTSRTMSASAGSCRSPRILCRRRTYQPRSGHLRRCSVTAEAGERIVRLSRTSGQVDCNAVLFRGPTGHAGAAYAPVARVPPRRGALSGQASPSPVFASRAGSYWIENTRRGRIQDGTVHKREPLGYRLQAWRTCTPCSPGRRPSESGSAASWQNAA